MWFSIQAPYETKSRKGGRGKKLNIFHNCIGKSWYGFKLFDKGNAPIQWTASDRRGVRERREGGRGSDYRRWDKELANQLANLTKIRWRGGRGGGLWCCDWGELEWFQLPPSLNPEIIQWTGNSTPVSTSSPASQTPVSHSTSESLVKSSLPRLINTFTSLLSTSSPAG